jgi:hypothetical protein
LRQRKAHERMVDLGNSVVQASGILSRERPSGAADFYRRYHVAIDRGGQHGSQAGRPAPSDHTDANRSAAVAPHGERNETGCRENDALYWFAATMEYLASFAADFDKTAL